MKKLLYTFAAALLLCACGTKLTQQQCPYQEDSFPIHGSVLKNVDSMEYYNALAAGIQVDAVFEVSPIDYAGHTHLVHGDTEYRIIRAYHIPGTDNTELTCTKG